MKSSKTWLLILLFIAGAAILMVGIFLIIVVFAFLLFGARKISTNNPGNNSNNNVVVTPEGDFIEFMYSPGYSDMDGASHFEKLYKNDNGNWVIESRDRDSFEEDAILTIYEVSDEDVEDFLQFVTKKNVLGLENRNDSDDFVTDYSEWSISFIYDNSANGGSGRENYRLYEYKEYSDKDYELIKTLKEKFKNMHGNIISQEVDDEE